MISAPFAWTGRPSATRPAGHTSVTWHPGHDRWGNAVIHIDIHQRHRRPCPHRLLCTHAKNEPRELTLKPRAEHEALLAARERQTTADWQAQYAVRAGIEGTLSQGTRAFALRQARDMGVAKTIPSEYPAYVVRTTYRHRDGD